MSLSPKNGLDSITELADQIENIIFDRDSCCNYKNLQPLWAQENRKKSNKLNYYD